MKINLHGHGCNSAGVNDRLQARVLSQLKESLERQIAVLEDNTRRNQISACYAAEKRAAFNSEYAIMSSPERCEATVFISFQCPHCGRNDGLLICEDSHTLSYTQPDWTPAEDCRFKDGISGAESEVTIALPSGQLLLFNHLGREFNDAPEGQEYEPEYELSTTIGRQNIANFLATKNVGFVQTTSGSLSVFRSPDSKHIVFSCIDPDTFQDFQATLQSETYTSGETQYEARLVREYLTWIHEPKYVYVGDISLEVWRWMCADQTTLDQLEVSVPEDVDVIQLTVPSGQWQVRSFYHLRNSALITGELKLT